MTDDVFLFSINVMNSIAALGRNFTRDLFFAFFILYDFASNLLFTSV